RSSTSREAQSAIDVSVVSVTPSRSTARFSSSYVAGCSQMFGLRTAPRGSPTDLIGSPSQARSPGRSDADQPAGRLDLRGDDAGRAVRRDPLDLDVLERGLDGLAEPLADT